MKKQNTLIKKAIQGKIGSEEERARRKKESKVRYEDKTRLVKFRLTEKQYNSILEDSKSLGFKSIHEFAKQKLIHDPNKKFKPVSDIKTIVSINKIGVNVNQIARILNTYKENTHFGELLNSLQSVKIELEKLVLTINKKDNDS